MLLLYDHIYFIRDSLHSTFFVLRCTARTPRFTAGYEYNLKRNSALLFYTYLFDVCCPLIKGQNMLDILYFTYKLP
jgi:hypothetical protein